MPIRKLFLPVFGSLLSDRTTALCISGVIGLQTILAFLGLPGWQCPILHGVGIPCPGCGLSRAFVLLLCGDLQTALTIHAFAPVLAIAVILLGCAGGLPERYRQRLISHVEHIERRTGITVLILISLLLYWAARLVTDHTAFIQLING